MRHPKPIELHEGNAPLSAIHKDLPTPFSEPSPQAPTERLKNAEISDEQLAALWRAAPEGVRIAFGRPTALE